MLEKLLNYLEVEPVDKYLFIGKSPKRPARIFGGQVLAQSLNASIRTVPRTAWPIQCTAISCAPATPPSK